MKELSEHKLRHDPIQASDKASPNDVRSIAKEALQQLMEPLAGFVLDSGLSAHELFAIFREAAVKNVVAKQLESSDRINISGIAATTGISRADISRLLKSARSARDKSSGTQQQSTNRILAAWHEDPRFTSPNGQPSELKLYGRGATFDSLAKRYGRGIPTRAVLDELIRAGAIELLTDQKVRANTIVAVERGVSARVIRNFGDRATELLTTMLLNMRQPDAPRFIANVLEPDVPSISLPLIRKELSTRSADFLSELREIFTKSTSRRKGKKEETERANLSVTIFCHETTTKSKQKLMAKKRRNFRRED